VIAVLIGNIRVSKADGPQALAYGTMLSQVNMLAFANTFNIFRMMCVATVLFSRLILRVAFRGGRQFRPVRVFRRSSNVEDRDFRLLIACPTSGWMEYSAIRSR